MRHAGQRQMHLGRARVRQAVDGKGGFVRDHAAAIGTPHLRPERGFHVLSERRDRIAREAIHPAGHAFDVAGLVELGEPALDADRLLALGPRSSIRPALRRARRAWCPIGDVSSLVSDGNNAMSLHAIDRHRGDSRANHAHAIRPPGPRDDQSPEGAPPPCVFRCSNSSPRCQYSSFGDAGQLHGLIGQKLGHEQP
jgi:hypothetical protein